MPLNTNLLKNDCLQPRIGCDHRIESVSPSGGRIVRLRGQHSSLANYVISQNKGSWAHHSHDVRKIVRVIYLIGVKKDEIERRLVLVSRFCQRIKRGTHNNLNFL